MEPVAFAKSSTLESSYHFTSYPPDTITMAYHSEFASAEDVKKYQLEEVWDRYHRGGTNTRGLSNFRFNWTINRGKDIYLMRLGSGREELSNQIDFLFWVRGKEIFLRLEKSGSVDFQKSVGVIEWRLSRPNQLEDLTEDLKDELRAALVAYGHRGASKPIGTCKVICNF